MLVQSNIDRDAWQAWERQLRPIAQKFGGTGRASWWHQCPGGVSHRYNPAISPGAGVVANGISRVCSSVNRTPC
ncbi:hypothethical protein [Ralstonia solanacearum PSI07]|uniref:Uncharacterized protein n=1 Tax=Ralstonia syzygii R24 TaxID=907261 RepID=G3A4I4_9RALS|nr:hypothethical protein [Ralstonia solanacearum PSI07]CCA88831.1 conserved hypothetical protein [Ralstonia syzygii R24]